MTMKQRGRLHAKTAWDKAAGEARRHDAQRRNQQGSQALFPRRCAHLLRAAQHEVEGLGRFVEVVLAPGQAFSDGLRETRGTTEGNDSIEDEPAAGTARRARLSGSECPTGY